MTGTLVETPTQITVRAHTAALAWCNAFLASSSDEDRPALYRTLSLEFFAHGMQLIGCDGTALFRTWVPTVEHDAEPSHWPGDDEVPVRSVVVMDHEGFGLGYMKTLLRLTTDEMHAGDELVIATIPNQQDAAPILGEEFASERLMLCACGQRTDLRLFEAPYPDWRNLRLGVEAIERVDRLLVAPRIFGLVGRLKGVDRVDLNFYGQSQHIIFQARGEVEVAGLLMPMRRTAD